MGEENSIKSLERYYNNKDEINEKQKKYFREVWYPNNRHKCLEYQRLVREGIHKMKYRNLNKKKKLLPYKPDILIERNSIVTF